MKEVMNSCPCPNAYSGKGQRDIIRHRKIRLSPSIHVEDYGQGRRVFGDITSTLETTALNVDNRTMCDERVEIEIIPTGMSHNDKKNTQPRQHTEKMEDWGGRTCFPDGGSILPSQYRHRLCNCGSGLVQAPARISCQVLATLHPDASALCSPINSERNNGIDTSTSLRRVPDLARQLSFIRLRVSSACPPPINSYCHTSMLVSSCTS